MINPSSDNNNTSTSMNSSVEFTVVDAFTTSPFGGNPAAVIVLPGPSYPSDDVLQQIAAEFNLSETAFLIAEEDRTDPVIPQYKLRWFTPVAEVELCGHATLASAHTLYTKIFPKLGNTLPSRVDFSTLSGTLSATLVSPPTSTLPPRLALNFPELVTTPPNPTDKAEILSVVTSSLKIHPSKVLFIGRNKFDVLVELDPEIDIETINIDISILGRIQTRAFIISTVKPTSSEKYQNSKIDFVSRAFGPCVGVPEDPVCGSAHCALAVYYGDRFKKYKGSGSNGEVLVARQVSKRGGDIEIVWDREVGRVELRGYSVTVSEGKMYL
ncbi:hypothetical protein HDU76_002279 [Blyttiomyces sp. JEL0837]|nr:hypothetical protein HDU76_002279 [Blyttiomyces sp. JEL0837]